MLISIIVQDEQYGKWMAVLSVTMIHFLKDSHWAERQDQDGARTLLEGSFGMSFPHGIHISDQEGSALTTHTSSAIFFAVPGS